MSRKQVRNSIFLAVLAAVVAAMVFWANGPASDTLAEVKVPELSALAGQGKLAFDANCARCHGANAAGSETGPPLVHRLYHPGHHGDAAFLVAALRGVRRHHWQFGNMPSQPQVTEPEILSIIRYVRELQQANGIGD